MTLDLKWILGIVLTVLGLALTFILVPFIRNYYRIFPRLTALESKVPEKSEVDSRLIKLEKDTEFVVKVVWQFLIAKVHSENDEFGIDELLDKWKEHKLLRVDEINRLIAGLKEIAKRETDGSKKAAAELLINMLDRGIGIVTRI